MYVVINASWGQWGQGKMVPVTDRDTCHGPGPVIVIPAHSLQGEFQQKIDSKYCLGWPRQL